MEALTRALGAEPRPTRAFCDELAQAMDISALVRREEAGEREPLVRARLRANDFGAAARDARIVLAAQSAPT